MIFQVTVGNIYPMTLELFQTLLNTAYTFFNIARKFSKWDVWIHHVSISMWTNKKISITSMQIEISK